MVARRESEGAGSADTGLAETVGAGSAVLRQPCRAGHRDTVWSTTAKAGNGATRSVETGSGDTRSTGTGVGSDAMESGWTAGAAWSLVVPTVACGTEPGVSAGSG